MEGVGGRVERIIGIKATYAISRLHPLEILLENRVKPLLVPFYCPNISRLIADRMTIGTKMRMRSMTGYL